mgnify:CR=1 FL=1
MTKARTLADFISDGNPLADGTISVAEVSGAAPLASPTFTGTVTSTGDIVLGDNDKAIFGAASDLQIYHDGTSGHSVITESGGGSLFLRGQAITMQNADGSKAYFGGSGDVATAYYGTSAKLATTATGIDVTGSVTADNLNFSTQPNYSSTSLGVYASGTFLNTSASTVGLLGVGGQGMVSWYTSGVGLAGAVTINEAGADADFRVESDGNTHMLFVDAGNNYVVVGGSGLTHNPSAGGLGISASGERAFSLQSSSADTLMIFKDSGTSATPPYLGSFGDYMSFGNYGGGTTRLGVNISAPTETLHVNGRSRIKNLYVGEIYASLDLIQATSSNGLYLIGGASNLTLGVTESVFNTNGANVDFRVESDNNFACFFVDAGNGRIGINQDVPGYTLDVVGGTDSSSDGIALRPANETQTNILSFLGLKSTYYMQFMADSTNSGGSDYFQFHAGTQDVNGELLFLGDGGTTFNQGGEGRDFRIESNDQANMFFLDAGNNAIMMGLGSAASGGFNSTTKFVMNASSDYVLGLRTTNSSGTSNLMIDFRDGDDQRMGVITGNASANTVTYGTSSDRSLKENDRPIPNPTQRVKELNPVLFDWISDGSSSEGFIAQELEQDTQLGNDAVAGEDGEKNVDYGKLTPLLTAALQDALAKIETLEARITALENA